MLTMIIPKRLNVLLGGTLGALLMVLVVALPLAAAEPDEFPFLEMEEGQLHQVQGPRQIFGDDLTIRGEIIDEDVLVYSGNVEIEDGGRINGDLTVFAGNITIDEESGVEGDLTAYSGNVDVAGYIGGDLANWSGNVELRSTAQVEGDISVVSGRVDREEGAIVSGNVMEGPSFRFGRSFNDGPRQPPGVSFERTGPSFASRVLGFLFRLLRAALMTAFVMLLVGGLFYVRPQLIADTRRNLNEQLALSAVIGVLANLTLLFLAGLMAITLCLLPLALLPMLALLAVNVVGWAVASQIAGERIVRFAKQEVQPILTILVGAFVLTGVSALLWAIGGCFRPLAFLLVLAVSSLGTGAVMVPWINKRRGGGDVDTGSMGGGDVPPSAPVAPMDPGSAPSTTAPVVSGGTTSSGYGTGASEAGAAPTFSVDDVVEHEMDAPIDHVTAEEVNATREQRAEQRTSGASERTSTERPSSRARTTETRAGTDETETEGEMVEQDVAAPIDYVTAQEVNTTDALSEGDDFLQIKGIGPTYARRLKEAGYSTYADLAAASPDEVGAAMGWPPDRVRRNEIIDQAQVLARG